jgi:acetyl-CoA carboxylase beta subunit
MVDMVVHRHQMRETVSRIARILMKAPELPRKVNGNGGALEPVGET